jgi:hypothetical protein
MKRRLRLSCKHTPLTRDTLQAMEAAIGEPEPGASDQIFHGAGNGHLSGPGQRRHARSDVNRYSRGLGAERLALAGVQACSNDDSEARSGVADGERTANGACGTIECRQEAE